MEAARRSSQIFCNLDFQSVSIRLNKLSCTMIHLSELERWKHAICSTVYRHSSIQIDRGISLPTSSDIPAQMAFFTWNILLPDAI